jgi:hypothetical protein
VRAGAILDLERRTLVNVGGTADRPGHHIGSNIKSPRTPRPESLGSATSNG